MYPENLSVCRAKSIKWQFPDLAKSGTAKWTKKAHASFKQAKHQQNRRGPTNKAHMEASQEEGGHMAAKGGSPDPTPRSADAPPGSADLTKEAHGLGREAMAVESGRKPIPALFLAPRPPPRTYK